MGIPLPREKTSAAASGRRPPKKTNTSLWWRMKQVTIPEHDDDDHRLTRSRSGMLTPPLLRRSRLPVLLAGALALFGLASVRTVPPAHVGVAITFGSVAAEVLGSGVHVTNPFASVVLFSTKTTLFEQANHVPTKEGLTVDLDVALLFHILPDHAREIYLNLGEDFIKVIVQPELSSAVRGLTSEAEAKALYTSGRSEMQKKLKAELTTVLSPRGIILEDVLLKAVTLPNQLTHAIELKAQAEQDSARMEFVLAKERQEAERKSIEAKGIADFQRIVSEGISPALLQWKGIEATEKLAESTNSKVVIMGNSKDSLPVILGGDTTNRDTGASAAPQSNAHAASVAKSVLSSATARGA